MNTRPITAILHHLPEAIRPHAGDLALHLGELDARLRELLTCIAIRPNDASSATLADVALDQLDHAGGDVIAALMQVLARIATPTAAGGEEAHA